MKHILALGLAGQHATPRLPVHFESLGGAASCLLRCRGLVQVAGHTAKYCRGGPEIQTIAVSPTGRGCNNIHILVKVQEQLFKLHVRIVNKNNKNIVEVIHL